MTSKLRTGRGSRPFDASSLARRLAEDEKLRAVFERRSREAAAVEDIVHRLDELRMAFGLSKAELARLVGKHPASVQRLFAARTNPELRAVVTLAAALDAELRIVPRRRARRRLRAQTPRLG